MAKGSGGTRNGGPASNPNLKGAGNSEKQFSHRDSMSYADALDNIMLLTGARTEEEADEMFWAIQDWSGSMSDETRAASRGENDNRSDMIRAQRLERFIEMSPKWNGGTTWRGLELSSDVIASFDDSKVGQVFDPLGIASWSTDRDVAEGFAGYSHKFLLRCEKPQNGTSIKFASSCPSEDEVTTSARCRYRITKVTKTDGIIPVTIVDVEPVANAPKKR